MHVSELRGALLDQGLVFDRVTNEMILGLCQTDSRFRVGTGQLLGLAPWVSMNRFTVHGAIRHAAQEQGDRLIPAVLYQRVDELVERTVELSVIQAELRNLAFEYDEQTECWIRGDDEGSDSAA